MQRLIPLKIWILVQYSDAFLSFRLNESLFSSWHCAFRMNKNEECFMSQRQNNILAVTFDFFYQFLNTLKMSFFSLLSMLLLLSRLLLLLSLPSFNWGKNIKITSNKITDPSLLYTDNTLLFVKTFSSFTQFLCWYQGKIHFFCSSFIQTTKWRFWCSHFYLIMKTVFLLTLLHI